MDFCFPADRSTSLGCWYVFYSDPMKSHGNPVYYEPRRIEEFDSKRYLENFISLKKFPSVNPLNPTS